MKSIDDYTDAERRILAALEEAGEENVAALLNTTTQCSGVPEEITDFVKTLDRIMQDGLLECATARDRGTLRWIPLPLQAASTSISDIEQSLNWDSQEGLWRWVSVNERLIILLTKEGQVVAEEVLSRFGAI